LHNLKRKTLSGEERLDTLVAFAYRGMEGEVLGSSTATPAAFASLVAIAK